MLRRSCIIPITPLSLVTSLVCSLYLGMSVRSCVRYSTGLFGRMLRFHVDRSDVYKLILIPFVRMWDTTPYIRHYGFGFMQGNLIEFRNLTNIFLRKILEHDLNLITLNEVIRSVLNYSEGGRYSCCDALFHRTVLFLLNLFYGLQY
jgi:hypothetical protein